MLRVLLCRCTAVTSWSWLRSARSSVCWGCAGTAAEKPALASARSLSAVLAGCVRDVSIADVLGRSHCVRTGTRQSGFTSSADTGWGRGSSTKPFMATLRLAPSALRFSVRGRTGVCGPEAGLAVRRVCLALQCARAHSRPSLQQHRGKVGEQVGLVTRVSYCTSRALTLLTSLHIRAGSLGHVNGVDAAMS